MKYYKIKNEVFKVDDIHSISLNPEDENILIRFENGEKILINYEKEKDEKALENDFESLMDFLINPNHLEDELLKMDKNMKLLQNELHVKNSFILAYRLDKKFENWRKNFYEKSKEKDSE